MQKKAVRKSLVKSEKRTQNSTSFRFFLNFYLFFLGTLDSVPENKPEFVAEEIEEDYRFLYIGKAGSRTTLHFDVACSYSWSANVVGSKRWVFFHESEITGC